MKKMDFFVEENRVPEHQKETLSPSGKFKLVVDSYTTSKGAWNYTRGQVIRNEDNTVVETVYRNYSSFWHNWIEHPNGNEYVFCGEDYQGYTIVNATQGTQQNLLHENARQGWGWCCAEGHPSPDGLIVAVGGCFWGGPYSLRFFDFSDPDTLPLPILDELGEDTTKERWVEDETFTYCTEVEVDARTDMEPHELGLSDDEWDEVYEKDPSRLGYRHDTFYWKKGTYKEVKETEDRVADMAVKIDDNLIEQKESLEEQEEYKIQIANLKELLASEKKGVLTLEDENQGTRNQMQKLSFLLKNRNKIVQSRWGWHYCTPFHYQKLKFLHKKFWEAIYAQARFQRWVRKDPHNRQGPEPQPVPIMTVDMEHPDKWKGRTAWDKLPKFRPERHFLQHDDRVRYVIVFADFQKARKPAATWAEAQPLELSEERVDELVKLFPDQPFFHIEEDNDEQGTRNQGELTTKD